jgi:hypothetical protein
VEDLCGFFFLASNKQQGCEKYHCQYFFHCGFVLINDISLFFCWQKYYITMVFYPFTPEM